MLDSPSSQLLFNLVQRLHSLLPIVSRNSFNWNVFSAPTTYYIHAHARVSFAQLEESSNGTRFNLGIARLVVRWRRSRPLLAYFLSFFLAIPRPIKPRTGKENKLRNSILGNCHGIPINNSPYLSLNDVQLNAI